MQFKLDGANLGTEDTASPYVTTWNTTSSNGTHTIAAVARDAAGNRATSTISVSVANPLINENVTKNFKTDFGAKGDGTTNDSPAFAAFKAWALDWQKNHAGLIELDMPPGTYLVAGTYQPWLFNGIKKLLVGYGATLKTAFTNSSGAALPYGAFLGGLGHKYRMAIIVREWGALPQAPTT